MKLVHPLRMIRKLPLILAFWGKYCSAEEENFHYADHHYGDGFPAHHEEGLENNHEYNYASHHDEYDYYNHHDYGSGDPNM